MFLTFSPHNCFEFSTRYIFLNHFFLFSKLLVTMCWTFLGTQSMISSQRLGQNLLDLRGKMRLTTLTVFDERPKPQQELFNLEQISQVGRKWITVQQPPASSRGCAYHCGCVVAMWQCVVHMVVCTTVLVVGCVPPLPSYVGIVWLPQIASHRLQISSQLRITCSRWKYYGQRVRSTIGGWLPCAIFDRLGFVFIASICISILNSEHYATYIVL